MRKSLIAEAVKLAFDKGYRVQGDGTVLSKSGHKRVLRLGGKPGREYWKFTVKHGTVSRPIPVHQLLAYQKFGVAALEEGVHVRHLNGDALDNTPDNIAIGSPTDNIMDRDPCDRKEHASNLVVTRKLSFEDVENMKRKRKSGLSYKEIAKSYGVVKSTAMRAIKGQTYKL